MKELRISDGFNGEKSIVLPYDFLKAAASHALISSVYPTDIGYYPKALNHYRERDEGCEQYIMIFCVDGKGFFIQENKKRIIKSNTLFFINPGTPHIYGSDEKNPWSIYWVHFKGANAARYLRGVSGDNPVVTVSIEKGLRLKLMFDDIIENLYNGYTIDSMIYVSQVLANLFGLLFFAKPGRYVQSITPIEKSVRYMTEHIGDDLRLDELAENANLSKSQYSFMFKEKTGFSPINYFTRLKIHRACQYLDTTDLSVKSIAKALGFDDPYYFSRAFHKIVQCSPTEYRKIKKG